MAAIRQGVPGVAWPALPGPPGAALLSVLEQLEQTQWWSAEQLRAGQLRQLSALVDYASRHVPYYAHVLREAGYAPPRPLDWDTFHRTPILERSEAQRRENELRSRSDLPEHGQVVAGATSGSTGTPLRYARSGCDRMLLDAFQLRGHLWHGRDLGARYAAIRTNVERGSGAGWGGYADHAFVTGEHATLNIREPIEAQVEWLARTAPAYLLSHATNLRALARHCLETKTRIASLREVCSFGETLPPDLPELARAAWGARVTDLYSSAEAGIIAHQCPSHGKLHVQAERVIVEVVAEDGAPCAPGVTGRVVITPLHNFAMPLIRYAIGDYAQSGEPCPCGRGLPVLARVAGRSRNMLRLPDGTRHWPSFPAELWLAVAPFRQFRLIQRAPRLILARYVLDRDLSPEEARRLVSSLQERLGFPFEIRLERIDTIERTPNAKYEDFVCEIAE